MDTIMTSDSHEPRHERKVLERDWLCALENRERLASDAFEAALKAQFPRERTGDTRYHSDRFDMRTRAAARRWKEAADAYMVQWRAMQAGERADFAAGAL